MSIETPAGRPAIASTRDPGSRPSPRAGLRVGFLAQENIAVPPPIPGASVSRVVYELARELPNELDVTICSLEHPTVPEGLDEGIAYLRVKQGLDRRNVRTAEQAIRILRRLDLPHRELQGWNGYAANYARAGLARLAERRPEVVHLQNVSQFVPLARQILPDAHIVLHMHAPWLLELPRKVVQPRLAEASLVLGVSEFIIDPVRNAFPELAERCHCLHNGVNLQTFPPRSSLPEKMRVAATALRRQWGASDGPVIMYVGTMAPIKGTHVLLGAFRRLLEDIPTATLVLVGAFGRYFQVAAPDSYRERRANRLAQRALPSWVETQARRLDGRVVFAGRVPHAELATHYAAADILAMPSTGPEAFPLPVLEAFASEVPVVASAIGGLPEIVQEGINGRLVSAGDHRALAEALLDLCRDDRLARRFGKAGRRLVEERFTWRAQAERLADLYDAALDNRA